MESWTIPSRTWPPITRVAVATYAGASGDWNPMHLDPDLARTAGLEDVIAHGMLTMAYLAQFARDSSAGSMRRVKVRFRAMVRLGDTVTCSGQRVVNDEDDFLTLTLVATNQDGDVVATGEAEVERVAEI